MNDLVWSRAVWMALVVVCGVLFLDALDVSMVGVALPSIGLNLHIAPATLQWIVSGYVLGYGGLLLLGGRTCDLLGRRQVLLTAVAVFGLASVVSAVVTDDVVLIALRFLKGASAAFTVPAGLSIVTTTFAEGPARNRAISIYSGCGACGFSSGLLFGGLLTELGWRATFLLPGPAAIALLVVGWRVIPRSERSRVSLAHFDLAGALTSTGALLVAVYAIVDAPARGWGSPATILLLLTSVALAGSFVAVERRHRRPLVRLGILRSAALVHANLSGAVLAGSYIGFQFIATLYLQDSLGWSPLAMALAFLPAGLIVIAGSARVEKVLARVGHSTTILIGLCCLLVAYVLFLRVDPALSYWNFLLPTIVLLGVGFTLSFPAINAQATSGVSQDEQGLASGLVNTSIQVGGAVVLAIVSALVGQTATSTLRHDQLLPGMTAAMLVVVAVTGAGVVMTAVRVSRRPSRAIRGSLRT